jgi:hypothetical protein
MKRKISPVPLLVAADFNAVKTAIELVKTKTIWRLALTGADKGVSIWGLSRGEASCKRGHSGVTRESGK